MAANRRSDQRWNKAPKKPGPGRGGARANSGPALGTKQKQTLEREQLAAPLVDKSPEVDLERQRCKASMKYLYKNLLVQEVCDKRTKKPYAEMWGRIHDLVTEFLIFDELEALIVERKECLAAEWHDPAGLMKVIPAREPDGQFPERWVYWPTLDHPPQIQDGPVGKISKMFHEHFWHGVIMRFKGDGLTKCLLTPRIHLKTELCTIAQTTWRIIRDNADRNLVRSGGSNLATDMVGQVKVYFDDNERFRKYFADLKPEARAQNCPWKGDEIQVVTKQRRGKEHTLIAKGIDSELTGGHFDRITLDDVVGEENTGTSDQILKVNHKVENIEGVRDPGTPLNDIGTRWDQNDAHGQFINPDSEAEQDTSFIVATLLDSNEAVKVPLRVTPLGYGSPIWPERWTLADVLRKRRHMPEDRRWFGQFFNQFHGTTARIFHKNWLQYYQWNDANGVQMGHSPEGIAKSQKLNILIGIDPASGKKSQEGKLDYFALIVLGQTEDRKNVYVLDGIREKLPAEEVAKAIVDFADKWRRIAAEYGGRMRVGFEESAYVNYLEVLLKHEIRSRGPQFYFSPELMKHDNKSKPDRIRSLARPYASKMIHWPESIVRSPIMKDSEPYDFITLLMDEMLLYTPQATRDDILDAHVYAFLLGGTPDYDEEAAETRERRERGVDSRARDERERAESQSEVDQWGGQRKEMWE